MTEATAPEIDKRLEAEITLDFPFDFDDERITALTMRRPKMKDKLKAQRGKGDEAGRALGMIAALVERPVEIIEELDEVDFEKLQDQYLAFTGRTSEMDSN